MTPDELVEACRYRRPVHGEEVAPGMVAMTMGRWTLAQCVVLPSFMGGPKPHGLKVGHRHTVLFRVTEATLHQPYGEVVMEDSPQELRRHLPILLEAHGRVLVTGLGLGCVVRGLLAKPEVEHVDVVEKDLTILGWMSPEFGPDTRVTLHHGDALTYDWPEGMEWDFAWHDLHDDDGRLHVLHAQVLAHYRFHVERQGAWTMERTFKRRLRRSGAGWLIG